VDSQIYDSSIVESLMPRINDHLSPFSRLEEQKAIINSPILSLNHSKGGGADFSIVLPTYFAKDRMNDILAGGRDLNSPPRGHLSGLYSNKKSLRNFNQAMIIGKDDEISDISFKHGAPGENINQSGLLSMV
jgi:hypothetical protein